MERPIKVAMLQCGMVGVNSTATVLSASFTCRKPNAAREPPRLAPGQLGPRCDTPPGAGLCRSEGPGLLQARSFTSWSRVRRCKHASPGTGRQFPQQLTERKEDLKGAEIWCFKRCCSWKKRWSWARSGLPSAGPLLKITGGVGSFLNHSFLGSGQNGAEPEVTIAHGRLKGRQANVKGTDRLVNVFLGIPFAKAPVGSLRFSPPEPPEPWNGLRDATSYPPLCPQDLSMLKTAEKNFKEKHLPFQTSEDCLYLNVYSPAGSNKDKLPVMVWIHGGNFIFGGAARYDGSALSAYENVLVVIIQYRLGLLGFFSTGDEHARGNWAFLDQVAALQWIQGNIEHFGGDPGSVTLFGVSAGSCSVFAHVLSPLSKNLFHKAISESGILIPPEKDLLLSTDLKKVASIFKCETSSSLSLINCLRNQEAKDIVFHSTEMSYLSLVLDGVFLPKSPEDILAGKEFNAVPYMIGVTNNEFGWNIRSTSKIPGLKEVGDKKSITSTLEFLLQMMHVPSEFLPVIVDEYLGNTDDPAELRDRFLDLLGDVGIVMPSIKALNYHRESGAPAYFFEYQHRPTSYWDSKPEYVKADHGDEVGFVFGGPYLAGDIQLRSEVTEEEKNLSRTLMKYWANFARNGNPNGEGLVEWPSYNLNEEYLQINLNQKVARKLKEKKVEFWRKLMFEKTNNKRMENKKVNSEL